MQKGTQHVPTVRFRSGCALACGRLPLLGACHTTAGAGQDISATGKVGCESVPGGSRLVHRLRVLAHARRLRRLISSFAGLQILYTGKHLQLVLMTLKPGEEIGEIHVARDQFFRVEKGKGEVVIDGHRSGIKRRNFGAGRSWQEPVTT